MNPRLRAHFVVITVTALLVGYLLFWPVGIDPAAWRPPEAPLLSGAYERNDGLAAVDRIMAGGGEGPEDVAIDSQGRLYAGMADGRIMRSEAAGLDWAVFANTGGRPLGLDFDQAGNLIVADAVMGLIAVSPSGEITRLASEEGGRPFRFTNDVDVAPDGTIYFSDASWMHGPQQALAIIIEHRPRGRLLAYDSVAKTTRRMLGDLFFANGVAVSADNAFVLVCETAAYRVTRYWLSGPRAGQAEVFIDNLPGFPDGISTGAGGIFWLAIFAPRNPLLDRVMPWPFIRKILLRLPGFLLPPPAKQGLVLGLDGQGKVVHSLQDASGGYAPVASVEEHAGKLYLGSLGEPVIGRLPVPE